MENMTATATVWGQGLAKLYSMIILLLCHYTYECHCPHTVRLNETEFRQLTLQTPNKPDADELIKDTINNYDQGQDRTD